jgi:putative tryptophan/tyrosine transport system substrate-binding protein
LLIVCYGANFESWGLPMRRREFIAGLGGAAAWPLAARGQQSQVPLIGYLNLRSPQDPGTAAFLEGLAEAGFVDGRNVRVIYRYAENPTQVPALAAELVRSQPAVMAANTTAAALAAKTATSAIPIVFTTGDDPVKVGLVASLNAPGGNATGATNLNVELEGKRLELMDRIVPAGQTVAALLDPKNPAAERQSKNIQEGADLLGRKVRILHVATERDIELAFHTIVEERLGAVFVAADQYFVARRNQIVTLATDHAIPAFYSRRDFVDAGGLMSYGTSPTDAFHRAGLYVGRILKGEKPADLPVIQSTKFEFVINLKSAKALGLTIPPNLLAVADEVIE